MFIYWLSNLNMGGGSPVGVALVSYVDPTKVTVVPSNDADPTQVLQVS